MKKLFTLLTMLVLGIGSSWAASPEAGAYPEEGKTYYFFANKYGSQDRYYLYWDNTNSVLKRAAANSKENTDYYKWTVTISDGKYYITNVGTKTKLYWGNSGLTLAAEGSGFDLSKQVDYSACVSLYYSNFWCCVQNSSETFTSSLKFSDFPGTGSSGLGNYSVDFVFEEVLSAHSLTNGKYYTIYCDNDSKQYLYDNNGTLAQTISAPASDYKYVWECIVSGDYYNFRNLQTGKYLSYTTISSSAVNIAIETTDVYHDGCVKLKFPNSSNNYMGFTKAGAVDHADHPRFPKITTDYSFDFRFDEVDLSSWITGDLLGGSMSGTDNWTNTWTSGTTPQFTLSATVNNINNTNNRTKGGLDIRSGKSTEYDTYTITAPTGYLITGYKIVGYALDGAQTVTPSKGGDPTVFTTAGNSISVSGLHQSKATFKLSGANQGLFIRALQVSITPYSSITSLPTANNKAYVIANKRATFNFADNATGMNVVTPANTNFDNTQQRIALIYKNENYYLFSVNAGKYLTASNTLTSMPTDNEQISITATGNTSYPWFFKFKNVANKNINVNTAPALFIDNWSTVDDGNRNAIIEVADFDATHALELFEGHTVTYKLNYNGGSTFDTESDVAVRIGSDPSESVPSRFTHPFVSLSYSPSTITRETTEVTVNATWNGPFDISPDFENANWYYLKMHGKYLINSGSTSCSLTDLATAETAGYNAFWAFVGDPLNGFQMINKAAGSDKNLVINWTPYMGDAETKWLLQEWNDNFALRTSSYLYLNNVDGTLKLWVSGQSTEATNFDCTIESASYRGLALAYLDEYAASHHMGEYFGVDESSYNTEKNKVSNLESMTEDGYNQFVSTLNTLLSPKLPETGYYRIKSSGSRGGESYISYGWFSDAKGTGLVTTRNDKMTDFGTIVKLTRIGTSENYQISLQGLNVQAHTADETLFTATDAAAVNFAFNHINHSGMCRIFDGTDHGYMHEAGWYNSTTKLSGVVGWGSGANASSWSVEDATSCTVNLNSDGATTPTYYATFCAPFSYTVSEGTKAYTLKKSGNWLIPKEIEGEVAAGTPVLLKGTSATATLTIGTGYAATPLTTTDLTGTYVAETINGGKDYVLGKKDGKVGFYHWNSNNLAANRAYLAAESVAAGARGFALMFEDDATGIVAPTADTAGETTIYNLSGQRLNKVQKGINIVNGKKVLF